MAKPKLEELIKDLDDPSMMDKILKYLELIEEEDASFMDVLVQKLKDEKITWRQPWYQKCNSITRPQQQDGQYDDIYRKDAFCNQEKGIIKKNWKEFTQQYSIPDKLICLARWKNKKKSRLPNTPEERARRFVVAYLSRGLQRSTYQVFRHIMTCYGSPVKGAYTPCEEKIMTVCFTHHEKQAVTVLSTVLSREPRGIYKRLQQMFDGKPEKKKISWSLPLATKFLKLLLQYTQLPLEELKYKEIDKEVWVKLGKDFRHQYFYMQDFWFSNLHSQLFVKESLRVNKLRKQVFTKLKTSSYQVWTDIRWKDLVKHFADGLTHQFLYKVCRGLVRKMPNYLKAPMSEICDYALNKTKSKRLRRRRLRTLVYENGLLKKKIHVIKKEII